MVQKKAEGQLNLERRQAGGNSSESSPEESSGEETHEEIAKITCAPWKERVSRDAGPSSTSCATCASKCSTLANMPEPRTVFFFDVNNTLLDHDRVTADLRRHLESSVGEERARRYWELFEEIRKELGYADYLGALQRYRTENRWDPHVMAVSYFLLNYPFANRLFPNVIDAVEHCGTMGADRDKQYRPKHPVTGRHLFSRAV